MEIKPFWSAEQSLKYAQRTSTVYSSVPLTELSERGLECKILSFLSNNLPSGAMIAGGYLSKLFDSDIESKDIDIFFTSSEAMQKTIEVLTNLSQQELNTIHGYESTYDVESFSKNSKTFRFIEFSHPKKHWMPKIQLIKLMWYESPESLIDTFDFTVAQLAIFDQKLFFNPLTPLDLTRKRLVLHKLTFPGSTIRRSIKYAKKGFYCCPGMLENLVKHTIELGKNDPNVVGAEMYLD